MFLLLIVMVNMPPTGKPKCKRCSQKEVEPPATICGDCAKKASKAIEKNPKAQE